MQAAGLMVAPPGGKGDREGDREDGAGVGGGGSLRSLTRTDISVLASGLAKSRRENLLRITTCRSAPVSAVCVPEARYSWQACPDFVSDIKPRDDLEARIGISAGPDSSHEPVSLSKDTTYMARWSS